MKLKIFIALIVAVVIASFFGQKHTESVKIDNMLERGAEEQAVGNLEEAHAIYSEVMEMDKRKKEVYINLSDIYQDQQDLIESKNILEKGMDATNDDEEIIDELIVVLEAIGGYEEEITELERKNLLQIEHPFPFVDNIRNFVLGVFDRFGDDG